MIRLTSSLLAVVLLASPLRAQIVAAEARNPTVAVSAQRQARLEPETALFFVIIEGTGETAAAAVAKADSIQANLRRAIGALGRGLQVGPTMPVSTGSQNQRFMPPQRGDMAPAPIPKSHRLALRISVEQIALLSRAMAAAVDAGATGIVNLQFESSKADSARRAQIASAVIEARREADAMAAAMGMRVDGISDVSTNILDRMLSMSQGFSPEVGVMTSPVNPEVLITTMINVRFRVVPAP